MKNYRILEHRGKFYIQEYVPVVDVCNTILLFPLLILSILRPIPKIWIEVFSPFETLEDARAFMQKWVKEDVIHEIK